MPFTAGVSYHIDLMPGAIQSENSVFFVNRNHLKTQRQLSVRSHVCVYVCLVPTSGVNQSDFCPIYKDSFMFQMIRLTSF